MSAIAGIYNFTEDSLSGEWAKAMMDAMAHHPADDCQAWHHGPLFLGCLSQWITPESIGERLPYYDQVNRIAVTADAILDNRQELFDRLQVKREDRSGMPDSRLIGLAYAQWGERAPMYLIGDFAFMIWDEGKRRLFGARDFSGGRTLYFTRAGGRFAFCTLIRPLLKLPGTDRSINEQWMAEYLAVSGMIDVLDVTATVYREIEQVPPCHSITVEGGRVTLRRYDAWSPEKELKLSSDGEYVEAFREVFQQAVDSRLRTHHEVAAQLSGGLDSGSIVSFAARTLRSRNKPLHTFSYIPGPDFKDFTSRSLMTDETPFIKSTVDHVGGIQDHYLHFPGRTPFNEMDDFLEAMESPYKFFENSFWLKGMFEKAAEERAGILLNGGRGNLTISWGSAVDYYGLLLKRLKWVRLARELNLYSRNVGGSRFRRLPEIARAAFPLADKLFSREGYRLPALIHPEFARRTQVYSRLRQHGMDESGWFGAINVFDQRHRHFEDGSHWNASNSLAAKLSLRYKVWKRDPTNDIRVVRFCLSVPEEQYVRNGMDRALIRRSTEQELPDKVRLNHTVRGVQGADWVHRMIPEWSAFVAEAQQMSRDPLMGEWLNMEAIKAAAGKAERGVRPEDVLDPGLRILMRSLIVYRFMTKHA